jgi:hypothetical protein
MYRTPVAIRPAPLDLRLEATETRADDPAAVSVGLGISSLLALTGTATLAAPRLRRQRIVLEDASSRDESDKQNDHRHDQQDVD